jgi:hypothetical protein
VLFSTSEPISLPRDSVMQRMEFPCCTSGKHHSPQLSMSAPVETVLGSAPLNPCNMMRNTPKTIQHVLLHEVPDSTAADSWPDSGTGSRVFKANMWMWRYGRVFPRKVSMKYERC